MSKALQKVKIACVTVTLGAIAIGFFIGALFGDTSPKEPQNPQLAENCKKLSENGLPRFYYDEGVLADFCGMNASSCDDPEYFFEKGGYSLLFKREDKPDIWIRSFDFHGTESLKAEMNQEFAFCYTFHDYKGHVHTEVKSASHIRKIE
ncbi:MAG: hypothetical protein FJX23_03840 [Alphaproteobacteria bacterium]|nr:hypothetical protein [Alphaproteobacteria bacterium]